jgi:predicted DNA binding CopG/RHH family protein
MAANSKIEWTDHTFNPWIGCQKVSPACDNCYAETLNKRMKWVGRLVLSPGMEDDEYAKISPSWGAHVERHRTSESNWNHPLRWNRKAERQFKAWEAAKGVAAAAERITVEVSEAMQGAIKEVASVSAMPEQPLTRSSLLNVETIMIRDFLRLRDFGKEESHIRAVLVEFVKFCIAQQAMPAAA